MKKKYFLLIIIFFVSINSFTQYLTRGYEIGEIYFVGPTHTTNGLYYSTDFGETAICVDSITNISAIAADKTSGGIYCFTYPSILYYSGNYGYVNSWLFKNNDVSSCINTGVLPGHIFSSCGRHSADYGISFINHAINGYFGSLKRVAIDNFDDNIGYVMTTKITVADTIYLFRTYDKFENLELINKLNYNCNEAITMFKGFNSGEVFMFNLIQNKLWISYDYFDNIQFVDTFNIVNFSSVGLDGGNESGELFLKYSFSNLMQQNRHLYIFHSMDYGRTFEVFHPFSKGIEPIMANFSTTTKEGNQPFTVEFCNFSIGNIQLYEWDFDNDGVIDSYEESPSWTYSELGTYSVSLTITTGSPDSTNTFVKEDYITVFAYNSQEIDLNPGYQFISSNLSPGNHDMLEVLENNLNENLDFVRNSQGQTLQKIGENWVNGIGDWINIEGYLFKMNDTDVLSIAGTVVSPQTPIILTIGYQFVSYLPDETMDALEAFSGILNDDLDFIRNSNGETIRKIGANWVNAIGDCNQGEGFLIKMNGEGVLVYP